MRDVGSRTLEGTAWYIGAASWFRVKLIIWHDRSQPAAMHHASRLSRIFWGTWPKWEVQKLAMRISD
jgi:hypothetical protein